MKLHSVLLGGAILTKPCVCPQVLRGSMRLTGVAKWPLLARTHKTAGVQSEGQARSLTGIGQPIPTEHAFATDREAMSVRPDQLEEELEVIVFDVGVDQFLALAVHDADV